MGKNRWPTGAAKVRWLSLDVDGVLTDGRLYYGADGAALQAFHVQDGHALRIWRDQGHEILVVSGRESVMLDARMAELGVRHLFTGVTDKRATVADFCVKRHITPSLIAHVGDDLPDLPLMHFAGLGLAPADAHPEVLQKADHVMAAGGGRGAVREAVMSILQAQGRWQNLMREAAQEW